MVLKRFCDNCKEEAEGQYAYLGLSKSETESIDLCRACEKVALTALAKRKKK